MSQTEKEYRSTTNRIGGALTFFTIIQSALVFVSGIINAILSETSTDQVKNYVIGEIIYGAFYMFSFMIPVAFYKGISKHKKTRPMKLELKTPEHLVLWILAAVAVCTATSEVNAQLMSVFRIDDILILTPVKYTGMTNYEIVINYILIALIPPLCEEFLFRGMVLENLLPYGKTTAIISSAALFALMHQNANQTFYTFCAGIAIGIVYEKTGSIWPGILIHLFNNQISNLYSELESIIGTTTAAYVSLILESVVLIAGLISIFILVTVESRKKAKSVEIEGAMGMTLNDIDIHEEKLTSSQLIKGFFTPWMIVFVVLSGIIVLITMLTSVFQI